MEQFNNKSNDRHREEELFESDSDFQLNLSLRSNFRVTTQNSTTSNSPQDLPAAATTATSQEEETLLTSQANESRPQSCTKQNKSEIDKDEIIFNLTRKLAEQNAQFVKANKQIIDLKRESETDKGHLKQAEENINELKRELKEKKGQLVNFVVAREQANKVEKFLTTVSGELGTFVKKLSSLIILNVLQIESKYLVMGPFQSCDVKNEFIRLINELATNISNNSATVEVVRDYLVKINTVLNSKVNLTQDVVTSVPRPLENVTPDIIECSPPPPQNLTSNPSSNENSRQEHPSKRVCRGIRQTTQTAPSTYIPNSHLLVNPPPLVPTTRAASSSASSTHKQSTFQSIRATPSSCNNAQYTLQIMETTSFSSVAHAQSTVPPTWAPPPSTSTHDKSIISHPWTSPLSISTLTQSPSSIYPQSIISHTRDASSYPSSNSQSLIPHTRPVPPLSIRDERSLPPIQVISLISPTRATTPTSSTHSQSMTPPIHSVPSVSPSYVHPRISHTLAVQPSSIPTQSVITAIRATPSSSLTHVQSTVSHPWVSVSPISPSNSSQSNTSLSLAEPPFLTCTQSMIASHQAASSSYFSAQGKSTITSYQAAAAPSSSSTHAMPTPLQPLEVNSLTPLNYNSISPSSSSRSTLSADHGLDLTSNETKHGIDPFKVDNICLCGRTFRTKATLKMHIQNHTTEGNFECDICKRRFHYPSVVKEHMMSAHKVARRQDGERVFICYICQKDDLASWEEFQEHLYTIHLRTPHRRH